MTESTPIQCMVYYPTATSDGAIKYWETGFHLLHRGCPRHCTHCDALAEGSARVHADMDFLLTEPNWLDLLPERCAPTGSLWMSVPRMEELLLADTRTLARHIAHYLLPPLANLVVASAYGAPRVWVDPR